jgi:2-polyprenyl-6-methoxyphenol hydroxylase-like FAD-dependent oxidoreductase
VRVGTSGSAVVSWNDPSGVPVQIDNVDLVVACDGRYSGIRSQFFGTPSPTFLGVAMYRILLPAGEDCPINDYGQWFNGPNRLLAFQVPGGFVYCAGSFPIVPGAQIPEHAKTAEFLRAAYKPDGGRTLSRECRFLVDGIAQNVEQLHWARVQEDRIFYAHESLPLLLLGDAAHPIVPTLGQGATLAVEDACVAVAEIGRAHTDGTALSEVRFAIEKRRRARAQFIADFSREASDTILEGADPVGGTLSKRERPFMARLEQLYRGAPLPTA